MTAGPGTTTAATDLAAPPGDPFDVGWRERVAVLGGLAALLLAGVGLGLWLAPSATLELMGLVVASFVAVGKFLPLWGISGQSQFGPYELGLVIWAMDTFNVIVFVYALEALYRIKPLVRWLHKIQSHAALVVGAYPRLRKMTRVGLVLFVLFPVAGTGAVAATFIGVLMRVHRAELIACVSVGALLGGGGMAFAAVHFQGAVESFRLLQENPSIKYAIVGGVVTLLALGLWAMNRAYTRVLEGARAAQPPGE